MNATYLIFVVFILTGTLIITYWSAKRNMTTRQFYSAAGKLTGVQNGLAISGDFMSAASFLGITGAVALKGFDGFLYSFGFLISFSLLLLLVAEPIHHLGTYTFGDVIDYRFRSRKLRFVVSCMTIVICILYMIPQLVAAGLFAQLLFGIDYSSAVFLVGLLIIIYVVFGGMVSTSWVQIIKTILLVTGTFLLTLIVLARSNWHMFDLLEQVKAGSPFGEKFFEPGILFASPLEAFSLSLTLILGTAGLPHILIRFFTVKNTVLVRKSIITATWAIGAFYLMTLILGFGVVAFVGWQTVVTADPSGNLAIPLLAFALGGDFLTALISAIAFSTILAVMTGLVLAATSSFTHDIYNQIFCHGKASERKQLTIAKIAAAVVGVIALVLSLMMESVNVTYLVSLTFMVAASTNVPILFFTLYWRRFNTTGAITGMVTGLTFSLILVMIGPHFLNIKGNINDSVFSLLNNPGIIAIPAGFLGAIVGTIVSKKSSNDHNFDRVTFKMHTGIER